MRTKEMTGALVLIVFAVVYGLLTSGLTERTLPNTPGPSLPAVELDRLPAGPIRDLAGSGRLLQEDRRLRDTTRPRRAVPYGRVGRAAGLPGLSDLASLHGIPCLDAALLRRADVDVRRKASRTALRLRHCAPAVLLRFVQDVVSGSRFPPRTDWIDGATQDEPGRPRRIFSGIFSNQSGGGGLRSRHGADGGDAAGHDHQRGDHCRPAADLRPESGHVDCASAWIVCGGNGRRQLLGHPVEHPRNAVGLGDRDRRAPYGPSWRSRSRAGDGHSRQLFSAGSSAPSAFS